MTTHEPITDTELEAMLARLTARERPDGLSASIMAAVDSTPQRRGPWFGWPDWRHTFAPELRLAWYLAIVALLLALAAGTVLIGSRLLERTAPLPQRLPSILDGMVTEEIQPGVFRVVNDGVRDLGSGDDLDLVAGYDGGIWLLRNDHFLRLGSDTTHDWPAGSGPGDYTFQVAPDGTMWITPARYDSPALLGGASLHSVDGEEWALQSCPDGCAGLTIAPDGVAWALWNEELGSLRVGQLGPDGWQPLEGDGLPGLRYNVFFGRLFVTEAGDIYGIGECGWGCSWYRYEDRAWNFISEAWTVVDIGPDGTVWQDGGVESVWPPGDGLTRYAEGAWTRWSGADLPVTRDDLGRNGQFRVGPDGSLWFSIWHGDDCDGLARFDGETFSHFWPGQCIRKMDMAADGSVWVLVGPDVYAITPEAVTAVDGFTEPTPPPLPVSLVTEEVEPGVSQVVADGVRDLSSVDAADVVAGYDGGIWLLRNDHFLRLGSDTTHDWPAGSGPEDYTFQVAPDGTMWVIENDRSSVGNLRLGSAYSSAEGQEWTLQACPVACRAITLAPDGSVWAIWPEASKWQAGRLEPTGWEPITGYFSGHPGGTSGRLFATEAGNLYATTQGWLNPVYRYEDGSWERITYTYQMVDVGLDGTLWRDPWGADPGDGLARFTDGVWTSWESADLPAIRFGMALDHEFKTAPDGSLWFSLWRSLDGQDPLDGPAVIWDQYMNAVADGSLICDGLARFDGERLNRFLPGKCISMDIAADGRVWILADGAVGRDLYVIDPEAAPAAE